MTGDCEHLICQACDKTAQQLTKFSLDLNKSNEEENILKREIE